MLDGPRIAPQSGTASALVVLLHGYGANGDDLIPLADEWRRQLPDAAFAAPNAPEQIPGNWGGLQWFGLSFRDPGEYWRGVEASAPLLDAFLDAELARFGLPPDRLALVGFSQGCMMALHVGPRRRTAPAGLVGLSGRLAGPEHLEREIKVRPPTLLAHGEDDELIPVDALHAAREALSRAGVPVEWHVQPGLGHGIDDEVVRLAGAFLAAALADGGGPGQPQAGRSA